LKGRTPCKQLVENDSERVEIRSWITGLSLGLLRREVAWDSKDLSGEGIASISSATDMSQTKIQDLDKLLLARVPSQEDIFRPKISMDNPFSVSLLQSTEDLTADMDHTLWGEAALPREQRPQAGSLDKLQDDKEILLMLTKVMHGDHIGVRESRDRADLLKEALYAVLMIYH